MQAQVTDLVLQRFQTAELADLPALLRFLLQHVNAQNANQVSNTLGISCAQLVLMTFCGLACEGTLLRKRQVLKLGFCTCHVCN